MSTERRGCRGGAKKRARFAIKSPIKLFEWSLRRPQRNKVEAEAEVAERTKEGSKSFRGYFHNGRRVGRRESGDATEVRARQSGAQISAASRPVTHPLQRQCYEHLDSETDMDAEGRLLEVKKVDINTFENNTTLT